MSLHTAVLMENVHLTLSGASGPVNVLKGVDLRLAEGENCSVVGPSGSGKTTMLMVMAGLEKPSSGRVEVAGQDLTRLGEDGLARFRRGRIGIVFQSFHLAPAMTALENVALPMEFMGVDDAFDRARAELESVGLASRSGHYPSQLSGGEQQRVALARAFAPRPQLILADEPTGNLDGDTGNTVMDLMFAMGEETGATTLLITHDMALSARCDRQVRMQDGRILEPETARTG